jgi:ABC-2 type transport system permease protein
MNFFTLVGKELTEFVKTKKLIILFIVFFIVAISGPLVAYLQPVLIKSMLKSMGEGTVIELPPASYKDAYVQMFQNLNQLGIIVLIILSAGTVVEEKVKGTAGLVLSNGVSRQQFVLSKVVSLAVLFLAVFVVSGLACVLYTQILFSEYYLDNLLFSFLLFVVLGLFFICISVFSSIIAKSYTIALSLGFGWYVLFRILGSIPYVQEYTPSQITNNINGTINGLKSPLDSLPALIVILFLSVLFVILGIAVFKKQEI